MIYTVKRIEEDLDFGCEERPKGMPVMAIVTLMDSSGEEIRIKAEDAMLYECKSPRIMQGSSSSTNNF